MPPFKITPQLTAMYRRAVGTLGAAMVAGVLVFVSGYYFKRSSGSS